LYKDFTLEPALVLHLRPFKETSFIVEFFTRKYGKVNLIAKGAKRPKSKLKILNTPACLFSISCKGKNQLKTLTGCEITEHFSFSSNSYAVLIYLNELLIKLLGKEDPHKEVFDEYLNVCKSMTFKKEERIEINLRRFEKILLRDMGYGLDFKNEANSSKKISEEKMYKLDPTLGFLPQSEIKKQQNYFSGKDILNFSNGDLKDHSTRQASKKMMRQALDYYLGNNSLKIRDYLSSKED